ncbi:hypothetical protein Vadar_007952 [Vaccinium darrowii]|uniref:Uncharacterized protein n=1 Tax=Vaccinium darrowii TaxID=229202 RepID=A0ACB7Z2I2_9ERIC|nr:hypothetical protein Vadar_007952 [Vaccinium darrowii]
MEYSKSLEIPNVHTDNPQNQEDSSKWRAPDKGNIKANCDVAINKPSHSSKVSVVFRSWDGKLLEGAAKSIRADSSIDGELQAIRLACEMANGLGLKEVEIESDNKQAISLSVSKLVPPWQVCAVVHDIRHFAKEGKHLFRWVRRNANKVAHEVASLALKKNIPCNSLKKNIPCNWVVNPPLSLVTLLKNDFNESL